MIKSFKHKGLAWFFQTGSTKGIIPVHARKLSSLLAALDTAHTISDMDIPGYRLHQLKGKQRETWSITVNSNWRLTFKFKNGNIHLLNYEDYH